MDAAQGTAVRMRRVPVFFCVCIASALIGATCLALEPRWDSNDDIAMSMVAHGFGLAAQPTRHVVFASVAWGWLCGLAGAPLGVPGYTWASYGALLAAGSGLTWAGFRFGLGPIGVLSLCTLFVFRAAVFPQFTVTAGLLMLACAGLLVVHALTGERSALWLAILLAFTSFLVRREEFLLVLLVLAPVLPWALMKDRRVVLAAALLLAGIAGLTAADRAAYQSAAWRHFNQLNPARAAFTDYGRAAQLKERPDILARHGFSSNDVDLVSSWFFVDSKLADPARLKAAVDDLSLSADRAQDLQNAWDGVAMLRHMVLKWTLACAVLMLLLFPSRRVLASWALCLAALALIGYLGRPGIMRVYLPLMAALVLAPLLRHAVVVAQGHVRRLAPLRRILAALALAGFAGANTSDVIHEWKNVTVNTAQVRAAMQDFPRETVVVWGDAFPFEDVYAPWARGQIEASPRIYGLGVFTFAPFSVAQAEAAGGRDMLSLLRSSAGVLALAHDANIGLLAGYCLEHFRGRLSVEPVRTYPFGTLRRLRCKDEPDPLRGA